MKECPLCSSMKFNSEDQCLMCDWYMNYNPKHTKEQAENMLIEYFEGNGITDYEIDQYDVREIMLGNYIRLRLDPHKYDDCE